jgi:hypothetical protein
MTMPVATPMAKLMPNSVPQNLVMLPPDRAPGHHIDRLHDGHQMKDRPSVSGTNRKWYSAVSANCRRDSSTTRASCRRSARPAAAPAPGRRAGQASGQSAMRAAGQRDGLIRGRTGTSPAMPRQAAWTCPRRWGRQMARTSPATDLHVADAAAARRGLGRGCGRRHFLSRHLPQRRRDAVRRVADAAPVGDGAAQGGGGLGQRHGGEKAHGGDGGAEHAPAGCRSRPAPARRPWRHDAGQFLASARRRARSPQGGRPARAASGLGMPWRGRSGRAGWPWTARSSRAATRSSAWPRKSALGPRGAAARGRAARRKPPDARRQRRAQMRAADPERHLPARQRMRSARMRLRKASQRRHRRQHDAQGQPVQRIGIGHDARQRRPAAQALHLRPWQRGQGPASTAPRKPRDGAQRGVVAQHAFARSGRRCGSAPAPGPRPPGERRRTSRPRPAPPSARQWPRR